MAVDPLYVEEPYAVRQVVAEHGHDLSAIGMPDDDGGSALPGEGLA